MNEYEHPAGGVFAFAEARGQKTPEVVVTEVVSPPRISRNVGRVDLVDGYGEEVRMPMSSSGSSSSFTETGDASFGFQETD